MPQLEVKHIKDQLYLAAGTFKIDFKCYYLHFDQKEGILFKKKVTLLTFSED